MLASQIKFDKSVYPRNNIDSHNVSSIVQSLRLGKPVAPIIVDKKTKTLTDGKHRIEGYNIVFGKDYDIPTIEKDYKSREEMFADSVALNVSHGKKLDTCDKIRCAVIGTKKFKISTTKMADLLNMPLARFGKLLERTAQGPNNEVIPLKLSHKHLSGEKLTVEQVKNNQSARGIKHVEIMSYLINALESECIDRKDEKVMRLINKLYEALEVFLAKE